MRTLSMVAAAAAAVGRECTLEGDPSSLFYAASALLKLQQMYGLIPRLQVRWLLQHYCQPGGRHVWIKQTCWLHCQACYS